jgi:PAS domain S-box-containing protein
LGSLRVSHNRGQVPSSSAQAAKLRGILESAVTAIITIDQRGLIEQINPATERLFGYAEDELVGKNVNVLMPEP